MLLLIVDILSHNTVRYTETGKLAQWHSLTGYQQLHSLPLEEGEVCSTENKCTFWFEKCSQIWERYIAPCHWLDLLSLLLCPLWAMAFVLVHEHEFIGECCFTNSVIAESEILLLCFLFQASFFFLSGILVMTGCMTLIILDWIQNVKSDGH